MTARTVAASAPAAPAAGPADADAKANNPSTVASLTDPANEQKLHVLLVEDDHATLVFVKALLKSCGHQGTRPLASSAPPARATGADPFREFGRYCASKCASGLESLSHAQGARTQRLTAFLPIVSRPETPTRHRTKQSRPR